MPDVIEFPLDNGGSVLVAVDETADTEVVTRGWGEERARRAADRANETLEATLAKVRPVTDALLDSFSGFGSRPAEITVEFAVQLTAAADVYIAKVGTAATFKVAVTWRPDGPGQPADEQSRD
ncbi:MAG TPA: CU044_2847 family protein [Actinoplanes sp.]